MYLIFLLKFTDFDKTIKIILSFNYLNIYIYLKKIYIYRLSVCLFVLHKSMSRHQMRVSDTRYLELVLEVCEPPCGC